MIAASQLIGASARLSEQFEGDPPVRDAEKADLCTVLAVRDDPDFTFLLMHNATGELFTAKAGALLIERNPNAPPPSDDRGPGPVELRVYDPPTETE